MASSSEKETSIGMPQLDFSNFDNQAFWLVVFLVSVFIVIKILVIPRMDATLTNRRKIIEEDIQEAEEFRDLALETEKTLSLEIESAREKANEILRNAKDQVKSNTLEALSEIDIKINEMAQEASENILIIKKKASKEIQALSKKLAPEVVKAILPKSIK